MHLESLTFKGCMPGLYSLLRRKDGDAVWLFYNDSTTELLGEILLDCSVSGHIMDLWIGEDTMS